jgi:DNA-binding XRE family transcriptional regulator
MTLRETREAAGLTQRDLAKLARVCRASISHVEHGRYAPTARFAGKICRALSTELGCAIHTWQLFPGHFCELAASATETAAGLQEQLAEQRSMSQGRNSSKARTRQREVRA